MKERQDICDLLKQAQAAGKQTVMASVVKIHGSAYRRPGAHMLFTRDGEFAGSISGGCLEGDLIERFEQISQTKQPILLEYSAQDIDDEFALGLGCNGSITVLLELIEQRPDRIDLTDLFATVESSREKLALATLLSGPLLGRRLVLTETGVCRQDPELLKEGTRELRLSLESACEEAITSQTPGLKLVAIGPHTFEVVVEIIEPSVQIVIFGAGYDARPLAEIAHTMGLRTCIFDRRPAFANCTIFPHAASIVVSQPDAALIDGIVDERSACIVMNHQIDLDRTVIACLLNSTAAYVGVLGPKRRTERMLEELEQAGVKVEKKNLGRLFSPVGVDIGAETPEEIALSILCEIKAVFQGRNAGFLRNKQAAIHADWQKKAAGPERLKEPLCDRDVVILSGSGDRGDYGDRTRKKSSLPACNL